MVERATHLDTTGSLDQSQPLKSRKLWPVRISHQSSLDSNNVAIASLGLFIA